MLSYEIKMVWQKQLEEIPTYYRIMRKVSYEGKIKNYATEEIKKRDNLWFLIILKDYVDAVLKFCSQFMTSSTMK